MTAVQKQPNDTSPRAAGPAGAQFEIKVATHYALAVLAQTEAFGLPGAIVDQIEFQRRGQGYSLDDIIVKGTTQTGERLCLEVQAKRSMSFTEGDDNFASVVSCIAKSRKIDPSRRFSVAIERTSGPIENGVQEALELSRHTIDTDSFFRLLETPGRSNNDMRRFVGAFKKHLIDNELKTDDVLFEVLKSFSVLAFDYARPQSIAEHHDRTRAQQLASGTQKVDPYDAIFGLILRSDAIGGETNRAHLLDALREQGVEISGSPNLAKARARVEEMSRFALAEIKTTVSGQQLIRADLRRRLEGLITEAETTSGVVEITGPGGAGKSGLLKAITEGRQISARIIVLAPDRTPPGGWPALRNDFGIDATAEEFLQDLSCDGGGLICVDGLDRFRDAGQRKTVVDVVSTALRIKGLTVLFTARPGWEDEAAISFGEELMELLSIRSRLVVEGLGDSEASSLAETVPALAPLLRLDHPAKALVRNPFILQRLLRTRLNTDGVLSEAELAWDWWTSGAHARGLTDGDGHSRRRVLLAVAQGLLSGVSLVDVSMQDASAVSALVADEVLVQISTDRVKFQHDLFTDWAVASTLSEDPQRIQSLLLNEITPFWVSRGFGLACQKLAESDDENAWPNLITALNSDEVKDGWIGLALLALVHSEHSNDLLDRYSETLIDGEGFLAASLIRRVNAAHGQPADVVLKNALPEGTTIPQGLLLPKGPYWLQLIGWCVARFERLPPEALSATIDLFGAWLTFAVFGEKTISPILLDRLADVLVANIEERDLPIPKSGEPLPKIKYGIGHEALETARLQLSIHAKLSVNAAERYLTAIARSKYPGSVMTQILEFPGHLPSAAPVAFCSAFLSVIREETGNDRLHHGIRQQSMSMTQLEGPFALGRCGISLFVDLLKADQGQGIGLIRMLLKAIEGEIDSVHKFSLQLSEKERYVSPAFSYGWSRGRAPSHMLSLALQALEYWGHLQIEAGEDLDDVISQIVKDEAISGAILLVVVDLVLSHSKLGGKLLADLITSPEILALDARRSQYDAADRMSGGSLGGSFPTGHSGDAAILEKLSGQVSRTLALHDVITQIVLTQTEEPLATLGKRLSKGVGRLGKWKKSSVDWTSPVFMASHAFRLASKENYDLVTEPDGEGGKRKGWSYRWPAGQWKWLQARSSESAADSEAFTRSLAIRVAMNDENNSTRASVADAVRVLKETKGSSPPDAPELHDPEDPWISRVGAAAFIAHFGSDEEVEAHRATVLVVFDDALKQATSMVHNLRYDVMYDAHALAIVGLLYLASRFQKPEDYRTVLSVINAHAASAVSAFSHHHKAFEGLGDNIPIAAVRIGLQACVFPRRKDFDEDDIAFDARQSGLEEAQRIHLMAELDWLERGGEQPDWLAPPSRRMRRSKRSLTLPDGKSKPTRMPRQVEWPDYYFNDHTAAVWLRTISKLASVVPGAVPALLKANREWLIDTNSPGEDDEDERDLERTWTRGLLECAAAQAKGWNGNEREYLIYDVFDRFSDEAFVDASAAFLLRSDLVHIEGNATDTAYLVDIRQRLWTRLQDTLRWRQHLWSSSGGMEIHLKELIAAFFFKVSYGFGSDTSYTKGLVEDQITPFLPLLTEMVTAAAPCPTFALLFLDVVELVRPEKAEPFLLTAATSWLADGDQRFWNEFGVGLRVSAIAEKAEIKVSPQEWIEIADAIAATGVAAGETLKQAIRRISR